MSSRSIVNKFLVLFHLAVIILSIVSWTTLEYPPEPTKPDKAFSDAVSINDTCRIAFIVMSALGIPIGLYLLHKNYNAMQLLKKNDDDSKELYILVILFNICAICAFAIVLYQMDPVDFQQQPRFDSQNYGVGMLLLMFIMILQIVGIVETEK